MDAPYRLETAISSFFESNTTATKEECDSFAMSQGGAPAIAVPIQGLFSYTVSVGANKIFQFRESSSSIDMDTMSLAATIHGGFVPGCKYHGTIGGARPLFIYEMDKIDGITYLMVRDTSIPQPPDSVARQRRTVVDFARFFAQAWNNPQPWANHQRSVVSSKLTAALDLLASALPPRFTAVLNKVSAELPFLLSTASGVPPVLLHGDLCEMNILVDPESGALTGIVDWAEARIRPFGLNLYGLENFLGWMDSAGWHYFDNAEELRELFWTSFRAGAKVAITVAELRAVKTIGLAGVFYRYGLKKDGGTVIGPVAVESPDMKYLDAFRFLGEEDALSVQ